MNTLKYAAVKRADFHISAIEKYYKQGNGSGSVTYYNFEAILDAHAAMEPTISALNTFLAQYTAYTAPTLPNGETPINVSNLSTRWNNCNNYRTQANNFKNGLKNLVGSANSASSKGSLDVKILDTLFNHLGSYGNYGWLTSINKLNTQDIQDFVNEIGLKVNNGNVTVTSNNIGTYMNSAVESFDKILVSQDIATLLDKITAARNEETGETTSFLGSWNYDYDLINPKTGRTEHFSAGTEIKTLREILVNTIISLLYSGSINTLFFSTIFPLVFNAMGGLGTVKVATFTLDLGVVVPYGARLTLPMCPTYYLDGSKNTYYKDNAKCQYYNVFNGAINGQKYPMLIQQLSKASEYNKNMGIGGDVKLSSWDNIDWTDFDSKACWHITDKSSMYDALCASTIGLQAALALVFGGGNFKSEVKLGGTDLLDIGLALQGSELYSRLWVPLLNVLGITGYASADQMMNAMQLSTDGTGQATHMVNYGRNFWQLMLDPILNWMETKLFVKPIETILEILPNLLEFLEYNQVLPKLENLALKVTIYLNIAITYTIDSIAPIDISGLILPMLTENGIVLDQGISGILAAMIKATARTGSPSQDDIDNGKVLMQVPKDANGNPDTARQTVARYQNNGTGTSYYFNNLGLLTQTLYNAFGDAIIKWLWFDKDTNRQLDVSANSTRTVPLTIPVNRFMAAGTQRHWTFTGGSKSITQSNGNPHNMNISSNESWVVTSNKGTILLELFR